MRKSAPESLARAPSNYAEVPKLGPPLPRDLGRPILEHQRATGQGAAPPIDPPVAPNKEEAEHDAQLKAARDSGLMVQLGARAAPTESLRPSAEGQAMEPAPSEKAGAGPSDGAGAQRKLDFARGGEGDLNPHRLTIAPSRWMLSAGTAIQASLVTGLNSDLPGMVVAQVTSNVFDSATGSVLLVPQGARLIGRYDSLVAFGQKRALVVWDRILFPDGTSVRLDKVPATDLSGYAGLEDRLDRHSWQLLKGIALSTLLGVGAELSLGRDESELVRALRESAQQNSANVGSQITSRNLDIQPTIRVRPGWPVLAVLNKDLVLRPWETRE
jgi:type IV secretion system protein VirB10